MGMALNQFGMSIVMPFISIYLYYYQGVSAIFYRYLCLRLSRRGMFFKHRAHEGHEAHDFFKKMLLVAPVIQMPRGLNLIKIILVPFVPFVPFVLKRHAMPA